MLQTTAPREVVDISASLIRFYNLRIDESDPRTAIPLPFETVDYRTLIITMKPSANFCAPI